MDEDSFIGELVQVTRGDFKALGKVIGVSHDGETADVSVFVMQVTDANTGDIVDCVLNGTKYPKDCSVELAKELPTTESPSMKKVDIVTVPRAYLHPIPEGVWCPLTAGYAGDKHIDGGDAAGAYGMQYRYSSNQADGYADKNVYPPYTEYIELEFQHEVFPYGLHIGCSRGCHATVSIKAL